MTPYDILTTLHAMATQVFPMEIKRQGTVFARIYKQTRHKKTDREFHVYQVADYTSGSRVLRSYTDFEKAKTEADTIADKRSGAPQEGASLTIRGAALSTYTTANELLKPSGIPLDRAAYLIAESVRILGSHDILEAIKFSAKRNPTALPQKTVSDIVEEFIATKKVTKEARLKSAGMKDPVKIEAELKRDRHLSDLRYRLGKFGGDFKRNLSTVLALEIEDWLLGLKLSPQSYLNFRRVIRALFKFAKQRKYLPKDHDEAENITPVDGADSEVTYYTPAELRRLLKAAPKPFLPSLAIGAFAGLRSSEIERLKWEDIDLKRKFIKVIGAKKRGTPSRRVVPIADNLAAWLAPFAKASGKVWTGTYDQFYDAQQDTAAATKTAKDEALEWKHNALRHSRISYRLAEIQDVEQVALESGNSWAVIHSRYKELRTPEQAKEWFGIVH